MDHLNIFKFTPMNYGKYLFSFHSYFDPDKCTTSIGMLKK